jgi:pimeloyl-ACP methyl ester carboxylesterase
VIASGSNASFAEGIVSAGDGVRMYYRDYGDQRSPKTAVLCLSGLTRNSKDFHGLAKWLSSERRVISLDYRGRGQSGYDPHWQNYQPETYVADVRHLLSALNLHRVFVVGTSLGGIVTMGMGIAMPGVLAGALLNDVGPDISMEGLHIIQRYMEAEKAFPDWRAVADHLAHYFPDLGFNTPEEWEFLARLSYRQREDGKIVQEWDPNIVRPLQNFDPEGIDLWPLFRSLRRIPLVTLRGEKSNILTVDTFTKMSVANPQMNAVTVPDVGHVPSLAEPQSIEALSGALYHADTTRHP